jgi:hypothetical protein
MKDPVRLPKQKPKLAITLLVKTSWRSILKADIMPANLEKVVQTCKVLNTEESMIIIFQYIYWKH